jgi:hypothetical protein
MTDKKVKEQIKAGRQNLQRNQSAQPDNLPAAVRQTGDQRGRSDRRFPAIFSLDLSDLSGAGPLEKCWWTSATCAPKSPA